MNHEDSRDFRLYRNQGSAVFYAVQRRAQKSAVQHGFVDVTSLQNQEKTKQQRECSENKIDHFILLSKTDMVMENRVSSFTDIGKHWTTRAGVAKTKNRSYLHHLPIPNLVVL